MSGFVIKVFCFPSLLRRPAPRVLLRGSKLRHLGLLPCFPLARPGLTGPGP